MQNEEEGINHRVSILVRQVVSLVLATGVVSSENELLNEFSDHLGGCVDSQVAGLLNDGVEDLHVEVVAAATSVVSHASSTATHGLLSLRLLESL